MTVEELLWNPSAYLGRRITIRCRPSGLRRWAWIPASMTDGSPDADQSRGILIKHPRVKGLVNRRGGASFPTGEECVIEGIFCESSVSPFPWMLVDLSRLSVIEHGVTFDIDLREHEFIQPDFLREIVERCPKNEIVDHVMKVLDGFRYH